jgi:hypothetical protein
MNDGGTEGLTNRANYVEIDLNSPPPPQPPATPAPVLTSNADVAVAIPANIVPLAPSDSRTRLRQLATNGGRWPSTSGSWRSLPWRLVMYASYPMHALVAAGLYGVGAALVGHEREAPLDSRAAADAVDLARIAVLAAAPCYAALQAALYATTSIGGSDMPAAPAGSANDPADYEYELLSSAPPSAREVRRAMDTPLAWMHAILIMTAVLLLLQQRSLAATVDVVGYCTIFAVMIQRTMCWTPRHWNELFRRGGGGGPV